MGEGVDVGPELPPDRFVEAELVAKLPEGCGGGVNPEQGARRVAWDEAKEKKRDDDDSDQHGDREEEPPQEIAQRRP